MDTENIKIRKVQQLVGAGRSVYITLPRDFANEIHLEKGDYLKVTMNNKKIILEKLKEF